MYLILTLFITYIYIVSCVLKLEGFVDNSPGEALTFPNRKVTERGNPGPSSQLPWRRSKGHGTDPSEQVFLVTKWQERVQVPPGVVLIFFDLFILLCIERVSLPFYFSFLQGR